MKKKLYIPTAMILVCLTGIAWVLYGYLKADIIYDTVKEDYVKEETQTDTDMDDRNYGFPDRDIDIEGLLSANPDFVCWLYYEDGKVDYPVVKERENDINGYMHRAFEGTKNSAGTIFMPYDADERFHDTNTFLYGHNMADGSMFGSLKMIYRDPAEKYKDPYFYIWTKDYEKIKYRVIAMYVVNKDSSMYAVPMSKEGYRDYFSDMMKKGSLSGFIPFTETETDAVDKNKPIVSLSTCYGYAGTDNRLLVQGVEIDRKPYKRQE